jgi:DNA polymerase (family 10)
MYIEPELRENIGKLEAARNKALPKLIEISDLQGTFHCHSTYRDGSNSVLDMGPACAEAWLGVLGHC